MYGATAALGHNLCCRQATHAALAAAHADPAVGFDPVDFPVTFIDDGAHVADADFFAAAQD